MELAFNGERVEYHPSVGLEYPDGRKVALDLVQAEDEANPVRAKLDEVLDGALGKLGYGLIVLPERCVRQDPRLPNAKAVLRLVAAPVDAKAEFAFMQLMLCVEIDERVNAFLARPIEATGPTSGSTPPT